LVNHLHLCLKEAKCALAAQPTPGVNAGPIVYLLSTITVRDTIATMRMNKSRQKITTRPGDGGKTSLCNGEVVQKNHMALEACGALDELCAFLGAVKAAVRVHDDKKMLEAIQRDLFRIGAEVAGARGFSDAICPQSLQMLQENLTRLQLKQKPLKGFCLPGDNPVSANIDIARAVCRRTERCLVGLAQGQRVTNWCVLAYINRLSALLYQLARRYEKTCVAMRFSD
jgi:cob(I)alamin adenosyltransferase